MDDGSRLPLIIAIVLLLAAAFFAVSETAVSSCSKNRIKVASDRGDSRAEKTLYVLENFDRAITTILVCTNIVHISIASLVTVYVTAKWGLNAVSISTIITTLVLFFAGEMLPKVIAKKYSERLALSVSGILVFLMKVLTPVSAVLTKIGEALAPKSDEDAEISVTEDELYDIIEDMTEEGTLDEEQGDLISSALQFGDMTAESILTPRVDLVAVDISRPAEEILRLVKAQNHSRLPVYEGSIDNITGILQIRKFISAYLRQGAELDVSSIVDSAMFVHSSTMIDELLEEMTREKTNIAVVTDNYGGTLGIVTVEDILEELVGEIWDEDDIIEENIVDLGEGRYLIDAEETVSDAFDEVGFEDPEEDGELVNTLMGEWAYEQFSSIPKVGDSFTYHNLTVTVAKMEHKRILKLDVTLLAEKEEGGAE